jgi:transcriptional regulator with XRE-family HTH domain
VPAADPTVIAPVGSWSLDATPIERERILRGWTPVHLATVAHVDPRTVRSLVAGRRRPSLGTVQALCTVLGLRLADVIVFGRR